MLEPNANAIIWPLEAIWQAIEPVLPGFTCEVLPTIGSTNTELMRRFKAGQLEPTLLVAEQQTAGRGRMGRQWHSQRTSSLMFSLGLMLTPDDWSGLSLAVGCALADSLDPANAAERRIALKWPNDLWLVEGRAERKLAGILVETGLVESQRYAVIGVGINVRANAAVIDVAAQSGMTIAPGYLQDLQPTSSVAQTLLRVVQPLMQTVQSFVLSGFKPYQTRFAQRDVLFGRDVGLSDGTHGRAAGVSETGALLVHTSAGMKAITSSEVSVRPCSD